MIDVYGAGWCIPCKNTKKFLDKNDIEYTYHDVEEDPASFDYIKGLGYSGIPVVQLSSGEHWQGFNLGKLKGI